jgi:hypothetical protein
MDSADSRTAIDVWPSPPICGYTIIEEWRVVDRWWTDTPINRHYRVIWTGNAKLVEVSEDFGETWTARPDLD